MTAPVLTIPDDIREEACPTKSYTPAIRMGKQEELTLGLASVSPKLRPIQEWLVGALSSRDKLTAPLGERADEKLSALMIVAPPHHNPAALATVVVDVHGASRVFEAVVSPRRLGVAYTANNGKYQRTLVPRKPTKTKVDDDDKFYDYTDWLVPLRLAFEASPPAEQARWRALAAKHRPELHLRLRAGLARVFREVAWAEEDAELLLAAKVDLTDGWNPDIVGRLLPYLDREDLFEALIAHAKHDLYQSSTYAEILVRPPASRAITRLVRALARPLEDENAEHVRSLVALLSCAPTAEAATAIAAAAHLAKDEAKAFFLAHPEHVALLEAQVKGRGKRPAVIQTLLAGMSRQRVAVTRPPAQAPKLPSHLAAPSWLARTPPWPAREIPLIHDGEYLVARARAKVAGTAERTHQPSRKREAEILGKKGLLDEKELAGLSDEAALANLHRLNVYVLPQALARFGERALPGLAKVLAEKPLKTHAELLALVRSPRFAAVAWSFHQDHAWLLSEPGLSALGLIPDLFAVSLERRRSAELGLLRLCVAGHRAVVTESAARYGKDVARAVAQILAREPGQRLPEKLPVLEPLWEDGSLPLLETQDGPLPPSVIPTIGMMIAVSTPWLSHPGLIQLREVCTASSRDALAWAIYEKTSRFDGIAHLGGDGAIRKLDALLSAKREAIKPDQRFSALEALAWVGTPLALILLQKHGLASPWADRAAHVEALLDERARARGLTRAQLEDDALEHLEIARELPRLDYGARAFQVVLDSHLTPELVEDGGGRVPKLPKPSKKDDADKAAAAKRRWDELCLDLDDVRTTVLTFFERAMAHGRAWEAPRFKRTVVHHPLLGHVARRLLFSAEERGKIAVFRVAEDGSFASVDDTSLAVSDRASVRVTHPLELSPAALRAFRQLFADYEIIQPFPQLERRIYRLEEGERAKTKLARFAKRRVAAAARSQLLGMPGWHNHDGETMAKPHTRGRVELVYASAPTPPKGPAVEIITEVRLVDDEQAIPFDRLTALEASELLRDLESLPIV